MDTAGPRTVDSPPSPQRTRRRWPVRVAIWIGWSLAGLVVLLLLLAASGAIYQTAASKSDARRFPPPGRMVDVGGHGLHLMCEGEGEPTVVLDTVVGASSLSWVRVRPDVARFTRVCAFDRAGYGWSDPGPRPRTSGRIVSELRLALEKAGLPKPYVLVGASFGGCNARLFAAKHPDLVSGLVLVDSAHEDQISRLPPSMDPAAELRPLRIFRLAARLGVLRIAGLPVGEASMGILPPEQQAAGRAVGFRTAVVDTIYAEIEALPESFAEVREAVASAGKVPFGSLPLVVLTHEEEKPPAGAEGEAYKVWVEMQSELAAESSRGRQIIVKPSSHFIAIEQPSRVVEAIRDVVETVRTSRAAGGSPAPPADPGVPPA